MCFLIVYVLFVLFVCFLFVHSCGLFSNAFDVELQNRIRKDSKTHPCEQTFGQQLNVTTTLDVVQLHVQFQSQITLNQAT